MSLTSRPEYYHAVELYIVRLLLLFFFMVHEYDLLVII